MWLTTFLALTAFVSLSLGHSGFGDGGINLGHQKGKFFENDILLPSKKHRNAIFKSQRWTDGIVPYQINPDSIRDWYTPEHVKLIEDTIQTIHQHTCIRFVKYDETKHKNYLKIHAGPACFTTGVGMSPGVNWVSLSSTGCMVHRIVIHELFHAIGLHHEQSRYDRDQYLTIHYNRLAGNGTDEYSQFQLRIVNESESTFYGIPYNYASVMHYDAWSLGEFTPGYFIMEPKNLYYLSVMGYAQTANETDYEKLRRLYDCKGSYPVVPPAQIPCVDEDKWFECNETYDYCDKHSTTIFDCRKTCGYCEWGKKPLSKQRPCKDWRNDCQNLARGNGCSESWMDRKCPLSCGKCKAGTMETINVKPGGGSPSTAPPSAPVTEAPTPPTRPAPPTRAPRPGCPPDELDYCGDYINDCGKADWMKQVCRNTCGFC